MTTEAIWLVFGGLPTPIQMGWYMRVETNGFLMESGSW